MRRRTRDHRALWFAVAVFAASAVAPASLRAQDSRSDAVVEISLSPQHERSRRRIENAVNESLARLAEWLGPAADRRILIADRRSATESTSVVVDLAWRPAASTMDVESQVSYGLARLWWPGLADDRVARPMVNGIAWYLQSRVVETLYDFAFLNPGHSSDAVRFFGGAVPWEFPLLRMGRWTAGLGRYEFVRDAPHGGPPLMGGQPASAGRLPTTPVGAAVGRLFMGRHPQSARRLPASLDVATIRMALAFGSLERHIGWPALQGALFESSRRARAGQLPAAQLIGVLGTAAGQDLTWLFEAARDSAGAIDYAVDSLSSAPCPKPDCVVTKVRAVRLGNAVFSGASRARSAGYESGDAIQLRVQFADGRQVSAHWDGRAPSRDFEFESQAPPSAVQLDPERVVLLDANTLNNDRLGSSKTNVPIRKWVARWVVWLQDATLSYASLF